jgi:serine/threonine-protein kinase
VKISNLTPLSVLLFRAGRGLSEGYRGDSFDGHTMWLSAGSYYLELATEERPLLYPVSLTGYRCGPDDEGAFHVTIRSSPKEFPTRLDDRLPEFIYIPSGTSLLGDRLNPREPHYVWLTGFFIAPFEVTNDEFRQFIASSNGYGDDANWIEEGRRWRATAASQSSALLPSGHPHYQRFGRDDQPVTWVTWYEAHAFCRWLTRTIGGNRWLFALPNEAEWEKVARGPDNFDYALGMTISDQEVSLYNWKKNPDALVTVVGVEDSRRLYRSNRFGVYHLSGNVVEWTQSVNRPYNREHPFADDDRNADETTGLRVTRGGSWYSASIAYLYIPYRDAFQREHCSQDVGFRVVARALP